MSVRRRLLPTPVREADNARAYRRLESEGVPQRQAVSEFHSDVEPFPQFQCRLDDLKPDVKTWIQNNIKRDAEDKVDGRMGAGDARPKVTFPNISPTKEYKDFPATNAFGKLLFERPKPDDESLESDEESPVTVMPSMFIRLSIKTPEDKLQRLLKEFAIIDDKSKPLRIHCLDYDSRPEAILSTERKKKLDRTAKELMKDLRSICKRSAGVILTWSGQSGDNVVHQALDRLVNQPEEEGFPPNMAVIATPLWSDLSPAVQDKLCKKDKTAKIATGESLGSGISPHATHFLFLDDACSLSTEARKSEFRHLHYRVIDAMELYTKEEARMPMVCLLIDGGLDSLKMVALALEKKNPPVVVVQDSGGYADIIADVYMTASETSKRERDQTGCLRTRDIKEVGPEGEEALRRVDSSFKPYLETIFKNLDCLTVYVPAADVQTLDSVVFEALLKHNQQDKFNGLVEIMQRSKKTFQLTRVPTESETGGLLESGEMQVTFFMEALKQGCIDIVKKFLDDLEICDQFMEHLHMGRILRLYTGDIKEKVTILDVRKRLQNLFHKLPLFPLRCPCEKCPSCSVRISNQSSNLKLSRQRTCLHPVQELFLWTLCAGRVDMAVVFWERCDDRIAAALVAQKIFKLMAKKSDNPDARWQMKENSKRFQELAVQAVKFCHEMNDKLTEAVLTKPCPWWGHASVLQLAIMMGNRQFLTQTPCKDIMTRIWQGKPLSNPKEDQTRPCQFVDDDEKVGCSRCCGWSPRTNFRIILVLQVAFLALFSHGLLSDLAHSITPVFYVIIVWVAAFTCEEFRQLLEEDSVVANNTSAGLQKHARPFRAKLRTYFKSYWNILDVVTLSCFWLGMLVFIPVNAVHIVGRCFLSAAIFGFFIRTFQMLMVYDELGLLLVMVFKMLKDTRNFMIILMIFVLAYAVTSESLLYPESDVTLHRLFNLPRKAYWQVFGELLLDEIEIRENSSSSCTLGNESMHYGFDSPHCPTVYGSYIVPVLLGGHVMITNVLLLNLLIARFGKTFDKVYDDACEYQSWCRCQLISEYYSRESLPPPCNIICSLLKAARFLFGKVKDFCCFCWKCVCCCCGRDRQAPVPEDAIPMSTRPSFRRSSGANSNVQGSEVYSIMQGSEDAEEDEPLQNGAGAEEACRVYLAADRRSLVATWDDRIAAESRQVRGVYLNVYTVKVQYQSSTSPPPVVYQVAKQTYVMSDGHLKQSLSVWGLNPSLNYTVTVNGTPATMEEVTSTRTYERLLELLEFEEGEVRAVCSQEEGKTSTTDTADWRSEVESLKQTISDSARFKQKFETVHDNMATVHKYLKEQVKVKKDERDAMRKERDEAVQARDVARERFTGVQDESRTLKEQHEQLQEKYRQLQQEKARLQEEQEESQERYRQLQVENQRLEAELRQPPAWQADMQTTLSQVLDAVNRSTSGQ